MKGLPITIQDKYLYDLKKKKEKQKKKGTKKKGKRLGRNR